MLKGYRGRLFDFKSDSDVSCLKEKYRFFDDGLLVIEDGKIVASGDYSQVINNLNQEIDIESFGECFILPGFIDAHVHSAQTQAIASYGNQLLDWLEGYIFPNERQFEQPEFALEHTRFFFRQLLKNGTTTAAIYPSIHDVSVEVVFDIASELNMRVITGKTWMDCNAPDFLLEDPVQSYESTQKQIEKWHEKGRLHYAITPRYAITSSPRSFELAASLLKDYPRLYLQTHVSENRQEVKVVNHHYYNYKGYLDVYDSFGLLTPRTLLGHGIYLTDIEFEKIAETKARIVHCPSSNLFLGSGLFDYHKILKYGINLAIGSDVGGGTSFSMLQNLNDAYRISALKNNTCDDNPHSFDTLAALDAFYLITLGGAKTLSLNDMIGNFDPGKEADFVVIDPLLNEVLTYRIKNANSIEDLLFALMILGDERIIKATYMMGNRVYNNNMYFEKSDA